MEEINGIPLITPEESLLKSVAEGILHSVNENWNFEAFGPPDPNPKGTEYSFPVQLVLLTRRIDFTVTVQRNENEG